MNDDKTNEVMGSRVSLRPAQCQHLLFFLSFVIGIGVHQAHAQQEPQEFAGTVVESKTMNPIEGALVVLKGTLYGTLTGPDGRFSFSGVDSGVYTLTISAEGYATLEISVHIQETSSVNEYVLSKADELPDSHTFLGSSDQFNDQLFRYLIPRRVDALTLEYSLFHKPLYAGSLYLDGVRLIDYGIPVTALIDLQRTEVVPDPYNPSLGLGSSAHSFTSHTPATEASFSYDSRVNGLHSSLMLHRDWSQMDGTVIGTYSSGDAYSDGSGTLQSAGVRSGTVAGRVSISPAPKHNLSASGGWLKDIDYNDEELYQRTAWLQYRFSQSTGLIRAIHSSMSIQEFDGPSNIRQQSARVSLHLVPQRNLSFQIGADVYSYNERFGVQPSTLTGTTTHSVNETGIFSSILYRGGAFLMEGQARVHPIHHRWGGATILTWLVHDEWSIIAGTGRTHQETTVTQSDLGFRWSGLDQSVGVKAFVRDMEQTQIIGMAALVKSRQWGAAMYTSFIDPASEDSGSQMVTWMRVDATISAPLDLFVMYPEIHGTFFDSPSWVSGSLWMETRTIGGISLRFGIQNIMDGTYSYPDSDFTEPGRSFQISVTYRP